MNPKQARELLACLIECQGRLNQICDDIPPETVLMRAIGEREALSWHDASRAIDLMSCWAEDTLADALAGEHTTHERRRVLGHDVQRAKDSVLGTMDRSEIDYALEDLEVSTAVSKVTLSFDDETLAQLRADFPEAFEGE